MRSIPAFVTWRERIDEEEEVEGESDGRNEDEDGSREATVDKTRSVGGRGNVEVHGEGVGGDESS